MKKTLLYMLVFTLIMSVNAYAEETVDVTIPAFPVELQGETINNANNDYPMIVYKGITYLPMTWDFSSTLGLKTNFYTGKGLFIEKSDQTMPLTQSTNSLNDTSKTYRAALPSFNVYVNGKMLNNSAEEYPILVFRDITYFPLTWRWTVEEFGLQSDFNAATGLTIKSNISIDNSSNNTTSVSDVNNSTVAVTNNNIDNSVNDSNNTYIDNSVTIINHIDNSITVTDQDNLNVTGVIVTDTTNDESDQSNDGSVNTTHDSKEKYSVDTLVGGSGIESGDTDGPVYKAKIRSVYDLTIDSDNNINFVQIGDNSNWKKGIIRKLDVTENQVETLVGYDAKDGLGVPINISYLKTKLEVDKNGVLTVLTAIGSHIYLTTIDGDDVNVVEQYTPNNWKDYASTFLFKDDDEFYAGVAGCDPGVDTPYFEIHKSAGDEFESVHEQGGDYYSQVEIFGKMDALMKDGKIYVLAIGSDLYSASRYDANYFKYVQLFPRSVETIESNRFDEFRFHSLVAYKEAFYMSVSDNIYKMSLDGKLSLFVDGDDLIYNDGNSINKIGCFDFDNDGNIILYDQGSNSIRRINMN